MLQFSSLRRIRSITKSRFRVKTMIMPAMEKEMLSAALAQSDTKETGSILDFYMEHYRPYVRPDLSLNQLSMITNIPAPILEAFYESTAQTLEQYLDGG